MTSWIVTVIIFLYQGFYAKFSRLIASFVGASVIDHGIMAGNKLAKCHDLLKLLIADVRFDLKSNRIFGSQNRFEIQVSGKTHHIL
jgi:hypothetical protein